MSARKISFYTPPAAETPSVPGRFPIPERELDKFHSPALFPGAGGSAESRRAGMSEAASPRSSRNDGAGDRAAEQLARIEQSHEVVWLKSIVANADAPLGERNAAERRLRRLVRKPKL